MTTTCPAPLRILSEAMAAAADRDMIARQYANGFQEVLEVVLPALLDPDAGQRLTDRMILTHVRLMSDYPDSLIRASAAWRGPGIRGSGRSRPANAVARARSLSAGAGGPGFLAAFGRTPAQSRHFGRFAGSGSVCCTA